MPLHLDEWGDQITITKEAVEAAARNSGKVITLRSYFSTGGETRSLYQGGSKGYGWKF
jgi:hypothetical protein